MPNQNPDAGYVESSTQDRYDSMRNIPTDLGKTAARGFMPVGTKAADSYGYTPSPESPRSGKK